MFLSEEDAQGAWEANAEEREVREKNRKSQVERQKKTLWLPDGESKNIYVRNPEPLHIQLHHGVFTKLSKFPEEIPCTTKTMGYCPMCDAGHRSSVYALYELIDLTGYKDKNGVHVVNFPMWFIASDIRAKTLSAAIAPFVKQGTLLNTSFIVTRMGTSVNTQYIWQVDDMNFSPSATVTNAEDIISKATIQWAPYDNTECENIAKAWQERQKSSKGTVYGL